MPMMERTGCRAVRAGHEAAVPPDEEPGATTFGPVMDWFEALTGFRETTYADTRAKLRIEGNQLCSLINGRSYGVGELELVSLRTLRQRVENILRLPCGKTPKFSDRVER